MTFSRTVLVTGGAKRIGAAIVKAFAAANFRIILHYHTSSVEALALAHWCEEHYPGSIAMTISADLRKNDACQQMANAISDNVGSLDVLINNASCFYPTPFGSVTEEIWNDMMDSNVRAAYFLTQACRDLLSKNGGVVINITDIHAEQPLKNYSVYSMAKAAWKMQTKALAKELAPDIRVNAVAPGAVLPPEGINELPPEKMVAITARSALQRMGQPEDIASAVLFLVENQYITGQTLHVDGGRLLIRDEQ